MFHFRKNRNVYKSYPKPDSCPFCDVETTAKAVRETEYSYIIHNRVSYDVWEMRRVRDHLMVIPKQHVHSLSDLSDAAKLDVVNLIAEYESHDYNVYARAVTSKQRSVTHQHTHLLKLEPKKAARGILYLKKPYLLIKF